ncbi:MAG TPA: trypsin-like peptidase domain-containing protein [Bryobacteraceae bacterium]|nr:trypsin-like peptidase domain-containing protein [Bryobacteraceae bacterium]
MHTFGEVAERLRRSTVQVTSERERSGGSGVVWGADGLIVTNAHVTRSARNHVELWDGRRFEAHLDRYDARRDLALLRIPASGLPAATPGDSGALRPGELAIAIGSPLGFTGALTTGVIHSVGPVPGMGRRKWVRATVRLAPGNSGGPLANAGGQVVGINTAIAHGLGLAVPSREVADFLRQGARPRLGVTIRPVAFDGTRAGMLVLEVESGGAADRASLRVGDILTACNGLPLDTPDALGDALDASSGPIALQFLRGDYHRTRETVARLEARAEAA